ncbi:MAG: CAP domain-containing protein [Bacteroidales bacterium]|nr:CAP domain-containing protein [Bacteroidales bacterium]
MKKITNLFALLLLSAALSATFTACDDDNEPENGDQPEINNTNDPAANDQTATTKFTDAQIEAANTAKDATYLSDDEKLVIFYINLSRIDGKAFAEAYLSDLKGSNNSYEKSLLTDLAEVKDRKLVLPNENLCKAAKAHANDLNKSNIFQHNSSDGTDPFTRIAKYYKGGAMAENIQAGPKDPFKIVRQLLIDNGTSSLGHRKNILNQTYVRIGVAIGPHPQYGSCCVQDFSDAKGD